MRPLALAFLSCFTLAMTANAAEPSFKQEHPGDVALVEEGGVFVYKQFPSQLRLYVFDKDAPGKLGCDETCILAWPPVWAHENSKPTGDWTTVERANGRKQWAYKGRPAYTRFHDSPTQPTGIGLDDGAWHLLVP